MIKVLSLLMVFLICVNKVKAKRIVSITNIQDCAEYSDIPITQIYIKMHNYAKNNRTMERKFNVKKEISGDIRGNISLKKCNLSGAPDTCEYFVKDFKVNDICTKINEKGQAWTPAVEAFEPKIHCPIPPGQYRTEEPIGDQILKFYPIPVGIWRASYTAHRRNEMLLCQNMEIKVVDVRRN